jgi:alkanesulfonate monooxygenase SsuD/methylene tetrahydromethanopterin reductase-like flavin-dependent oxidoreductase (luciferase family)
VPWSKSLGKGGFGRLGGGAREGRHDLFASIERSEEQEHRHMNTGGSSSLVVAGSPASMRAYLDEYVETGANYFVCSFQWGDLTHEQAMLSIKLLAAEVMPHYV